MLRESDDKGPNSEAFIVMNPTVDWQEQISLIAGPKQGSDTKESWLWRAARLSGATFWHVKSLYEGKLTDPKYSIAHRILSAADRARINEAKRNAARLSDVYQTAAHALGNIDQDFHRNDIDALVNAARILGALDSSGARGVAETARLKPEVHLGFDPPK